MWSCKVSHLPLEIGKLISVDTLYLGKNNLHILPDSIFNLACLERLSMKHCNVLHLPSEIARLISLKTLDLDGNNLHTFPDSPTCLDYLSLKACARLQSLPELPVSLRHMEAKHCTSLESLFIESDWQVELFTCFLGCNKLSKNYFADNFENNSPSIEGSLPLSLTHTHTHTLGHSHEHW